MDTLELLVVMVVPTVIALLFLFVPPRYIKRMVREALPFDDPEDVGIALATAMEEFFGGHTVTNPETGEEVELSAGDMALMFGQQLMATAVMVGLPYVMEELPVLVASMNTHKWSEEMQEKSAVARGVSKLDKGIKGYQAFQKGMKGAMGSVAAGFKADLPELPKPIAGLVGVIPYIGQIKKGIQEIREVLPKAGGADGTEDSTGSSGAKSIAKGGTGVFGNIGGK